MNIHAEFGREEDGRWVAEIPRLPEARAYGSTRREAAIGVTIRAFHILAERVESGELKVEDEPGAIILGGTAETLSELLVELQAWSHSQRGADRRHRRARERGLKSFVSDEEPPAGSSASRRKR